MRAGFDSRHPDSMKNFYKPGIPLEEFQVKGSEHKDVAPDTFVVPHVSQERDDEEAVSSFIQEVPSDEEPYDLDKLLHRIKKNPTPRKAEFLFGEPLGEQTDTPRIEPKEKAD